MPLSQEQQLDAILTIYGPIIGIGLILVGVSLCLAGPKLLPFLTAWALFIPFSLTSGAIVHAFLGVEMGDAIWIGIAVGAIAGVVGQSLGKQIHIFIGGAFGMAIMAVILSLVNEFYELNWWIAAIALDLSFIIGARLSKNMREAVTFVGSSSLGAISLAAGVEITSAGIQGLESWSPRTGISAITIMTALIIGTFFQQWRYGDSLE